MATQIWVSTSKIKPKMSFFTIFLSFDQKFPLKLHTMIVCDNVYHLVEVKPRKMSWGPKLQPNRPNRARN